jgi:hypothetical protein
MIEWWFNIPRRYRLALAMALVVFGALLAIYQVHLHGDTYRRHSVGLYLFALGLMLLLLDFIFPDHYLEGAPEEDKKNVSGEFLASIPKAELSQAIDALAKEYGMAIAVEKSVLLAAALHLPPGESKDFHLAVPLKGKASPLRLRFIGCADDTVGCGFLAEANLLHQIRDILARES